jgi:hypothetical protein
MYHPDYIRYVPSPAYSSVSSGVSTPGMTPPLPPPGYMFEQFLSHPPSWVPQRQPAAILPQLLSLQQQTSQLISMVNSGAPEQVPYYPTSYQLGLRNAHGPSPAPAPAVGTNHPPTIPETLGIQIARSILDSAPIINEQVIAKAVVAVANALVMKNTPNEGYIHDLGPRVFVPEAIRSQTPAWLSAVAENATDIQSTPVFGGNGSSQRKSTPSPEPRDI